MNRKPLALAVAALAALAVSQDAGAEALTQTIAGGAGAGSVTVDSFANTGDGGVGSYKLTTGAAADKASVFFTKTGGGALGTLGDLSSLTFDYYVPGTNTTSAAAAPAIRFFTNGGFTEGLVWENAYQTPARDQDAWQNDVEIVGADKLWQRANGANFDSIANLGTKADFEAGFTPTGGPGGDTYSAATQIFGVQISFGSGVGGDFTGYVDDVNVEFVGASAGSYTAAVPEPAGLGLLALGGVMLLGRRARRAAKTA